MSALDPSSASSAARVAELAHALYGVELGAMRGVLHVAAVAGEGDDHRVLRIGAHAPKSPMDSFVLHLARARVEAIVVTGAVLREEPDLRYDLAGPGTSSRGLIEWRRDVAQLVEPPWLLVLTRGELRLDHPALHGWARPLVLTTPEGARRIGSGVEVVAVDAPSVRAGIAHLVKERACRSVGIEAGPSTAGPLYDPPLAVDELWLSVFQGAIDPRARGGLLPSAASLASAGLVRAPHALEVDEANGAWRFERWTRWTT